MRRYILLLFILLAPVLKAQQGYNRIYNAGTGSCYGKQILALNNGSYLIAGIKPPTSSTDTQKVALLEINGTGDSLNSIVFSGGSSIWMDDIISTSDSCVLALTTVRDTAGGKLSIHLYKIDPQLNILWNQVYTDSSGDYSAASICQTALGYSIAGYKSVGPSNTPDILIINVDTSGNYQSSNILSYAQGAEYPKKIIKTTDNNFLIVGTRYYNAISTRIFLAKLSSSFQPIWLIELYDPLYPFVMVDASGADVIEAKDSTYIVVGMREDAQVGSEQGYIAKIERNGGRLWDHSFGHLGYYDGFNSIVETAAGDFMVAGSQQTYASQEKDWLMKVSANGDSLWSKYYWYYGPQESEYFYDIVQVPNGGFIMCGLLVSYILDIPSHIYVVKTDSLGYDGVNWSYVGEAETMNAGYIKIYPNPFNDVATVVFSERFEELTFVLYDQLGQEVKHLEGITDQQFMINREGLSPGIYFYEIIKRNEHERSRGKLVIQ